MRAVVHLAVDADRAGAGIGGEGRHHGLRLLDLLGGRREHRIDHRHLRRVNGEPSGEAVAARHFGVAAQALGIAEVDIDRLDRRQLGRRRAVQAHRARQPIGLGERAVGLAVGLGAELGRQVFRAPGHADQTRARIAVGAGREQPSRRLNRLRDNFDRALGQPGDGLARGQLGIEMGDGGAAFRLGKQHGVRPARHDGVEIGIDQSGVEPVDAHQQARTLRLRPDALEEIEAGLARRAACARA